MSLHLPQHWPWAQVHVCFTSDLPPTELVQSVHMVAFLDGEPDCVILCREENSDWFLPGGTREPGEAIDACLVREMREEAGAELLGPPIPFGAHVGTGYLDHAYRPHLPHPRKAWLWCCGTARITQEPSSPPGAEQVAEVSVTPFAEARRRLGAVAAWYPQLLDLAKDHMAEATGRRCATS